MTRPAILDRLRGVQRAGKGWLAFCPSHPDREKRSLSVGLGDDGRTLVKCHARGCTVEQITAAVGMTVADLAPPAGNGHRSAARQIVAAYDYTDERGEMLYQVVRYDNPKHFFCRRPDGRGGWVWDLAGVRIVPYRLHELAEASRVFVPEGEKDCETLGALGLVTTCNHGGAKKWREEHTRTLVAAAVPEVVVLRDNDLPGAAHQDSVAKSCAAAGLRVRRLLLPGLPPLREKHGEDVSDWLSAGHTKDELLALADETPLFMPGRGPSASTPASPSASPSATTSASTSATTDGAPTKTEPTIVSEGDDYRVTWPDGAEFVAVSPHESSEGIHAEATVTLGGNVLSWGRLNLASTSGRAALVRTLHEAAAEVPWRERLELACRSIAERMRTVTPFVALLPAPRPPAGRDLIENVIPLNETSLIFGDGDSGKGMLALTIGVSLISGQCVPHLRPTRHGLRVGYLDWETSKAEIEARLDGLCRGLGITLPPGSILYREMSRGLADDAARLRADLDRHKVDFVIVDSLVPACGNEPEGADATIRALNALRSFRGTTRLVIGHVNRVDADKTKGSTRPWGSVFVRNLVRAAWEVKRSDTDGDDLVFGCYLNKRNDAKRGIPPWGLRFTFTSDGLVTVQDEPLARTPDLLAKATAWQQVYAALSNGPKAAEAIALELDVNVRTVRRTLERRRDMGHVVVIPTPGEAQRWALATRRSGGE